MAAASVASTVTILSDDFEGSFPGSWELFYSQGSTDATIWGKSTYRYSNGSASAWCAGGGSSPQPPGGTYVANMGAWLYYGPFDLSDATDLSIDFDLWNDCETSSTTPPPDRVTIWLSTDDFATSAGSQGFYFNNTSQQWTHVTMQASQFNKLSLAGAPGVSLAFIFNSGSQTPAKEGAYIDAVRVTKTVSAPQCSLSCSASVPATAAVGAPVAFQITATPSNCTGSPTYAWDFGDSSTIDLNQNPTHTYSAPGSYTWNVLATLGSATCVASGTINVTASQASTAGAYEYWVPVVTHSTGAAVWRSDLGLLNLAGTAANVELRFRASSLVTKNVSIPARGQLILTDVVNQIGTSGSAALEIRSDQPLHATCRTYTLDGTKTYGQGFDAIEAGEGAFAGQSIVLPLLTESARFRTNIGVTNTSSANAAVEVELLDSAGVVLNQYDVSLAPGVWAQEFRPFFNRAGKSNLEWGFARINVTKGSGIIAYATVTDNDSQDPTRISTKVPPQDGSLSHWVPVAAHNDGLLGSRWRTDVAVVTFSGLQSSLTLRLHVGSEIRLATETVPPGAQIVLTDVASRFSFTGTAALEVLADQPVAVMSRTYTLADNGTFGQDYDSLTSDDAAGAGDTVYLPQLTENSKYRSNIVLNNISAGEARATVELYSGTGAKLGDYPLSLAPGARQQETQAFLTRAGQTNLASGYAKVLVTSGSGVLASASVLDNSTNDPTRIWMKGRGVGAVAGTVLNTAGSRLFGVTVTAVGQSVTTDSQGEFTLSGVPAGPRVVVQLTKSGFVDGTVITKVSRGLTASLDTTLKAVGTSCSTSAPRGRSPATPARTARQSGRDRHGRPPTQAATTL